MEQTGSVVQSTFDASSALVPNDAMASMSRIDLEVKVLGQHMEGLLTAIERGGACESYQMQIARALLGSLIDAIEEMGQLGSRAA